jgi:DNA-binding transcriptional MerR regulator
MAKRVLISSVDAARIYGVPARTIRYWAATGRICRYGQGKSSRYDDREIEQILAMKHPVRG